MFDRKLSEDVKVSLATPNYSEEYFELINKNRKFWETWIPWVHEYKTSSNCSSYINQELQKFAKCQSVFEFVFYKGKLAGGLGVFKVDKQNSIGEIGYFLGEKFTGKGIMTLAVKDLILLAFDYFSIEKVEIRPATENVKSREIPKRLGFKEEGIIRNGEKVYDNYYDIIVYGILKVEFKC